MTKPREITNNAAAIRDRMGTSGTAMRTAYQCIWKCRPREQAARLILSPARRRNNRSGTGLPGGRTASLYRVEFLDPAWRIAAIMSYSPEAINTAVDEMDEV